MQNKTDKGTLLVSKSLPVANLNSVNRLFSARKKKCYVSKGELLFCRSMAGFLTRGATSSYSFLSVPFMFIIPILLYYCEVLIPRKTSVAELR